MIVHSVVFPEKVSRSSTRSLGNENEVVRVGADRVTVKRQDQPLSSYTIRKLESEEDAAELRTFFRNRDGAGFLFRDPLEFHTHPRGYPLAGDPVTDVVLGSGPTMSFQLRKIYTDAGGFSQERLITRPKLGTWTVTVDGVLQTDGVDYTINPETGILTFATNPGAGLDVAVGGEFYVPAAFTPDTDADFRGSMEGFAVVLYQAIEIEELPEFAPRSPAPWHGGSREWGVLEAAGADLTTEAAVWRFQCDVANREVRLADSTALPGNFLHVVANVGSAALEVRDPNQSGALIVTVGAGKTADLRLVRDSQGQGAWTALLTP